MRSLSAVCHALCSGNKISILARILSTHYDTGHCIIKQIKVELYYKLLNIYSNIEFLSDSMIQNFMIIGENVICP